MRHGHSKTSWALIVFALALAALIVACRKWPTPAADLTPHQLQVLRGLDPDYTKWISADNPPTGAKVELGKKLYFDPRLSVDGTLSCATCHNP